MVVGLFSCKKSDNGQLVGVQDRPKWGSINPYGMIYVPSGTLHIGPGDQDVNHALVQRRKAITIGGFYMDDTEITNNEYRQFVYWVRDSIALTTLGATIDDGFGGTKLDWEYELDWSAEGDGPALEAMYYDEDERFYNRRALDASLYNFSYDWIDWKAAANNFGKPRSEFIHRAEINIYPDTLCWIRDFSYAYNEPMTQTYYSHPAYDDYPVVGISWHQANAFSYWRSMRYLNHRRGKGETVGYEEFRLPIEHEWEYAARGGNDLSPFPWGGPYLRNRKGCLMANFKPGRGNYSEDGGAYTVKADSYWPNDYGLYNMAGNAAEWTSSAYYENAYSFINDMNPDVRYDAKEDDPEAMKRKVVRGGSWKDIGYFLQTGTRNYEFQDTTKAYIGFRNVLTFVGRSIDD